MNLTVQEAKFFDCLQQVNPETIWGHAIKLVVKEPTEEKVRGLIQQLKSQDKDNSQIMQEILTPDCYRTLIEL